jgi:hypothetical protein
MAQLVNPTLVATPADDELVHLRGLAAWMVQSALLSGEDGRESFHDFVIEVRVDQLSVTAASRYELVTFAVHRGQQLMEHGNYLREIRLDVNQAARGTLDVMAGIDPYFIRLPGTGNGNVSEHADDDSVS